MCLRDHFEGCGNWLFRWRSLLPFLLFLLLIPALPLIHRPLGSNRLQNAWEVFCFALSITGLLIRCFVGGHAASKTSGRNTHSQVAESLNTTGIYSIVRHPLYLGNFLMWLGIVMFCFVPWVTVIFVLCFWLYYERIMFAEEEFLRRKFGDEFSNWASQTPAFVPRFSSWRAPSLPFSFKSVLRREYTGLLGITIAFACMDQFEHLVATHRFSLEIHWIVISAVALLAYVGLRTMKKRTTLLNVPRR